MDIGALAGAFGSVVEPAATVAARNTAAQQLGDWGIPQQLNPFVPPPTAPPPPTSPHANVAPEDRQPVPGGFWARYQRLIIIGGAIAVAALVFLRKRRK